MREQPPTTDGTDSPSQGCSAFGIGTSRWIESTGVSVGAPSPIRTVSTADDDCRAIESRESTTSNNECSSYWMRISRASSGNWAIIASKSIVSPWDSRSTSSLSIRSRIVSLLTGDPYSRTRSAIGGRSPRCQRASWIASSSSARSRSVCPMSCSSLAQRSSSASRQGGTDYRNGTLPNLPSFDDGPVGQKMSGFHEPAAPERARQ